ncbi:hypothetical protein [Salinivibrio kushneri]|uniref:hypothetical protein n=1 Tax=Salinivibrio kushneri TaxID=1908198 RepID=UPI0022B3CC1D|nr:hypothetical protein [Salinivibrio kushneri]WBA13064.1 hypothetical protein O4546_14655 [Salinivibrio kushneri]
MIVKPILFWSKNVRDLALGNEVRELMAEFMNFEPIAVVFPDEGRWIDEFNGQLGG